MLKVRDDIYCLPTDYPDAANAPLFVYLLRSESSVLVDTGIPSTYDATMRSALSESGVQPREIQTILITHAHPDHQGGATRLRHETGARVAVPLEDAAWVEHVDRQWKTLWDGYPGALNLSDARTEIVDMCGGDLAVDVLLRDGDELESGAHRLQTVLTRGHSPGHCAFFDRTSEVLFAGDMVQLRGLPACDGTSVFAPLYHDVDDYIHGLERLRALPFRTLCTAHFGTMDRDEGLDAIDISLRFVREVDDIVREMVSRRPSVTTRDVAAAIGAVTGTVPPHSIHTVGTATAHLQHAARLGLVEPSWTKREVAPRQQ